MKCFALRCSRRLEKAGSTIVVVVLLLAAVAMLSLRPFMSRQQTAAKPAGLSADRAPAEGS